MQGQYKMVELLIKSGASTATVRNKARDRARLIRARALASAFVCVCVCVRTRARVWLCVRVFVGVRAARIMHELFFRCESCREDVRVFVLYAYMLHMS